MSDIKVGDLVVVVRGHACDLGRIYTVMVIRQFHLGFWRCADCGCTGIAPMGTVCAMGERNYGNPLSWLRRIPPLSELDDVERKQETPA